MISNFVNDRLCITHLLGNFDDMAVMSQIDGLANELTARVGDGDRQAAFLVWVSIISSPSVNVMPWMTFGN
jgi:hypothetical protein